MQMLKRECVRFHLPGLPRQRLGTEAVRLDGGLSSPGVGPPEQHCRRRAGRAANSEEYTVCDGVCTPRLRTVCLLKWSWFWLPSWLVDFDLA